ncbi:TolC family protein [Sulfurimonas sp.]|uniref:TolC family protein n=1 Tax=Sulfurimonas sp. TaxID=2022749 RepID=UPI0026359CF0|nr:TolC family protein [Sulfurimonas sp.]
MSHKSFFKYLGCSILALNLHATEVYTVDELIVKSLQNSPELKVTSLNYKASQKQYDISYANYLPRVDLKAAASKVGMSDLSNQSRMIDDTVLLGKLSVKQIIYDFGKTGANVDVAKYDSEATLMQNIQKISDKKREVKGAYYTVLQANALINVQNENVKLNAAQLYRAKKYFKAGIRTKIDISDAKVNLIRAKIELKNALYNLKLAYASLDKIVGFNSLSSDYKVYTPQLHLNTLYQSVYDYDLSLSDSILYAYDNRAQLKASSLNVKSVNATIAANKSQYYPALYFNADYTKQSLDTFKQFQPQDQWQAGVTLNWNLYEGGATQSQTQRSKILTSVESFKQLDLKLKIKENVTKHYINLHRNKDTLELAQSLMEASAQKFYQASKRYEHDLSDYIELEQARQGYINAKASLIINYYNYYIAVANLENAIGR